MHCRSLHLFRTNLLHSDPLRIHIRPYQCNRLSTLSSRQSNLQQPSQLHSHILLRQLHNLTLLQWLPILTPPLILSQLCHTHTLNLQSRLLQPNQLQSYIPLNHQPNPILPRKLLIQCNPLPR